MFSRYKGSLIQFCETVRAIQKNPVSEASACLHLQLKLVEKIVYIENKISQLRISLRQQHMLLKSKKIFPLEKNEAQVIRDNILFYDSLIDEYQHVLRTFKTIGDALAFIYIDKWDIKPQAFKQSPGYLSGKAGLKQELKMLKLVFSAGGIGLLTDLTNCLRYSDIVIVKNKRIIFVEVKSSHHENARVRRQITELKNMRNYLKNGKSDKKHSYLGHPMIRRSIHSDEINHMDRINNVIKNSLSSQSGFYIEEVENGLYYGVVTHPNQDIPSFHDALKSIGIKNSNKLIVSFVNELKQTGIGYYPFSLSIYDPKSWYEFCSGEIMIVGIVNHKIIQDRLRTHGLSIRFTLENEFALEISHEDPKILDKNLISRHFFGRLFSEFLSLDWLITEIITLCAATERQQKIKNKLR